MRSSTSFAHFEAKLGLLHTTMIAHRATFDYDEHRIDRDQLQCTIRRETGRRRRRQTRHRWPLGWRKTFTHSQRSILDTDVNAARLQPLVGDRVCNKQMKTVAKQHIRIRVFDAFAALSDRFGQGAIFELVDLFDDTFAALDITHAFAVDLEYPVEWQQATESGRTVRLDALHIAAIVVIRIVEDYEKSVASVIVWPREQMTQAQLDRRVDVDAIGVSGICCSMLN